MENALTYLGGRIIYRVTSFFKHWYVDGFWFFAHKTIGIFEKIDRHFAVKIMAKNFWQPLYQDYSIPGRIMGIFFRSFSIIFGSVLYLIVLSIALSLYALWSLIPVFVIIKIITSLRG